MSKLTTVVASSIMVCLLSTHTHAAFAASLSQTEPAALNERGPEQTSAPIAIASSAPLALMPTVLAAPAEVPGSSNVQIQLMLKPEELLSKKKSVLGGAALSLLPGAGLVYAEKPLAGALVAGLFAGGVGCMMMGMGSSEFSTTYLADFTVVGYVDTVGGTAFQVCGGAILSSFLVSVLTTVPTIRLHNRKVEALHQLYQNGAPPVTLRLNGAGLEGRF